MVDLHKYYFCDGFCDSKLVALCENYYHYQMEIFFQERKRTERLVFSSSVSGV